MREELLLKLFAKYGELVQAKLNNCTRKESDQLMN